MIEMKGRIVSCPRCGYTVFNRSLRKINSCFKCGSEMIKIGGKEYVVIFRGKKSPKNATLMKALPYSVHPQDVYNNILYFLAKEKFAPSYIVYNTEYRCINIIYLLI